MKTENNFFAKETKYGKNPHIRKILSEHGVSKDKKGVITMEEEEGEEETAEEKKTASKRQRSSPKKREASSKRASKSMVVEEEKERSKSKRPTAFKKDKEQAITKRNAKSKFHFLKFPNHDLVPLAKIKLKSTKKQEEDKIEQRVSSRSKKIRKLEEDFYVTDWRGIRKTKRGEEPIKKQENHKPITKTSKNSQIIENWVQCDNCNKWRILKTNDRTEFLHFTFLIPDLANTMSQLLNKKKLSCSNLPGRSCSEPEDKQVIA